MAKRHIQILFKLAVLVILLIALYACFAFYKKTYESFENNDEPANDVSILDKISKIYYINLKHRTDRNDEFLSNFSKKDQMERIHRIDAHYNKSSGAAGCLKSHIMALTHAQMDATNDNDIVLICEDDLHIKDMNRCNQLLQWCMEKRPSWDVIMLAHNTHASNDTEFAMDDGTKIIRIQHSATTSGYIARVGYLQKILKIYSEDYSKYESSGEFSDFWCTDVSWVPLQKSGEWYAFVPTIAVQRKSYSDIQKGVTDYGV